jgi:hypothetical protein
VRPEGLGKGKLHKDIINFHSSTKTFGVNNNNNNNNTIYGRKFLRQLISSQLLEMTFLSLLLRTNPS